MSTKTRTSTFMKISAGLAVGALALAACSSGGGGASGDDGGDGGQEVTFWGNWTGEQATQIETQVEAFNASQDDYVVTYQPQEEVEAKLLTAIAGGGVPDVVLWDRFATSVYASKGALMSLEDLIASDSVDTSMFYEAALNELTYDGTVYGIPLTVDNRSLFYNADLLTEAGLEPPTNWAELADAAEALTVREGGTLARSGFALSDVGLFSMWLGQAGGQMVSDDGQAAFNTPEGLAVLEEWDDLMNNRGVYDLGFAEGTDGFAEGTVAMAYNGPWTLATYDAIEDLNYGIVAAPAGPNGDQASGLGGFGMIIPEGAPNVEGAWEFIKWWTTQPENGVAFAELSGNMPANLQAAEDPFFTENEAYSALLETMAFATARPTIPGYSDAEGQGLIPELQRFMAGEISAQEALDNAEESFNRILAENA
ncbi:ABC transporter substrate-binding protein [Occultella kanbiaonis]|uniref:ABC transporter substrate-binding protein n=1 Tax=Occultella kanbiaonis TaxID=2675754 RepID=UPI001E55709E|nr:ABC transporter substrate-binding protein [Occultella kanbiaonis]